MTREEINEEKQKKISRENNYDRNKKIVIFCLKLFALVTIGITLSNLVFNNSLRTNLPASYSVFAFAKASLPSGSCLRPSIASFRFLLSLSTVKTSAQTINANTFSDEAFKVNKFSRYRFVIFALSK